MQFVERSLQQGILLSLATSKSRMPLRMGKVLGADLLRGVRCLQASRSRKQETPGSVTKRLLTVNTKPHLLQASCFQNSRSQRLAYCHEAGIWTEQQ